MISSTIDPAFFKKTSDLEIHSPEDLLLYLPKNYLDYQNPIQGGFQELKEKDEKLYMQVMTVTKPIIESAPGRPTKAKVVVSDGRFKANIMAFKGAHEWRKVQQNELVFITAKYGEFNGKISLKDVEIIPAHQQGRVIPVYKGKEKVVSTAVIEKHMNIALRESYSGAVQAICERVGDTEDKIVKHAAPELKSLKSFLYALHRPSNMQMAEYAQFTARMINAYRSIVEMTRNKKVNQPNDKSIIPITVDSLKEVLSVIPFQLTSDQKRSIWDISKDLNEHFPMDRLVSGDVGCGKTLTYLVPAICAYLLGKSVVVLTPNLLLCTQIASEAQKTFPMAKVRLAIANDCPPDVPEENEIIVGTSAVFNWMERINYRHKIDFLIIDEQQKLGSKQREKIISENTNVLEATATAIPRTSANVIFGDKKVSYIEECPVDKKINTKIIGTERKRGAFERLKKIANDGAQVAVLYPIRKVTTGDFEMLLSSKVPESVIEEIQTSISENGSISSTTKFVNSSGEIEDLPKNDKGTLIRYKYKTRKLRKLLKGIQEMDLGKGIMVNLGESEESEEVQLCKRSVESAALHWEEVFPGEVVSIHGGMKTQEKIEALEKAKSGQCKVIVTSSVIEIGLTMPDLRALLVLEADKYGASTLHQFRGRLARLGGKGIFILMLGTPFAEAKPEALKRLNILANFNKGSQIAEQDMMNRGFGDLKKDGIKQHGFLKGIFNGLKHKPQDVDELLRLTMT